MTKKQFLFSRLIIIILLSITMGVSVIKDIAIIPPLAIIASAVIVNFLYSRVKEVTADERDYKLAGQAARMTLNIFIITITALGTGLVACGAEDIYYKAGFLLLYSVCFVLVLNIFIFLFYQKKGDK